MSSTDPSPPGAPTGAARTKRRRLVAASAVAAVAAAVLIGVAVTGDDGGTDDRAAGDRASTTVTIAAATTTTPDDAAAEDEVAGSTTSAPPTTTTTSASGSGAGTGSSTTEAGGGSGGTGGTGDQTADPSVPTTAPVPAEPTPAPLPGFSDDDPDAPAPPAGPQGPVQPTACTDTGPPVIASSLTDAPSSDGRRWRTVGSASGNCGGGSPSFSTSGVDTRIVVRSDADQFLAFIEEVADPDSNAGYADVVCRTRCSDETILVNGAGTYRLRIQATDGPWVVEVQEYR